MPNYRRGRINDEVRRELSALLREIKDPRVQGAMISITAVEVTPALKYAAVYFSVLAGDPEQTRAGLESAAGFIRREIAARLNLRNTPQFSFRHDRSIEHGAHIAKLLGEIGAEQHGDSHE